MASLLPMILTSGLMPDDSVSGMISSSDISEVSLLVGSASSLTTVASGSSGVASGNTGWDVCNASSIAG